MEELASKNKLVALPTDKTARNGLIHVDNYVALCNQHLLEGGYRPADQTEFFESVKIVKKTQKQLLDKMLVSTNLVNKLSINKADINVPKFSGILKDHKKPIIISGLTENSFPVRPIASVQDTYIEKLDWLISVILGQILILCQYHEESALTFMDKLHNVPSATDPVYFSLDVVSLFPSVPTLDAPKILKLKLIEHQDKINTFGLNENDIYQALNTY